MRNFIWIAFLYMSLCFGRYDPVDGMVRIEGGEFEMGSDEHRSVLRTLSPGRPR